MVLVNGVPDMDEVRTDLEKAGIPFLDERGRRIDYHALRTTFITRLSTMKVHPRVAMELARHSDMRLTMKTYTDVGQLPLREVMDSLPGFGSDSRIDSRNLGPTGQTVSQPVTETRELKAENTIANKGESHDLTAAVPVCHSEPENGVDGIRIPLSPPGLNRYNRLFLQGVYQCCYFLQVCPMCLGMPVQKRFCAVLLGLLNRCDFPATFHSVCLVIPVPDTGFG